MAGKVTEQSQEKDIFDGLLYQREGSWAHLPGWAKFFLKLGSSLSTQTIDGQQFTMALSLPTRTYAACLVAAGIVYMRSLETHHSINKDHLAMLINLKNGTPLVYREGGRKYKAIKVGVIDSQGRTLILIQVDFGKTNTVKGIRAEDAEHIEIAQKDTIKLPKAQAGHEITPPSQLIKSIFTGQQLTDFVSHSNLETVIIGRKNAVKDDMHLVLGTTKVTRGDCHGILADLIRAREFQPPGIAYRSDVLASVSKSDPAILGDDTPSLIIFDGHTGYLKWREDWRGFNWLVVLDRTDLNFSYAVSQINQEYLSRAEKQHKLKLPAIPTAVEIMYFTRDNE